MTIDNAVEKSRERIILSPFIFIDKMKDAAKNRKEIQERKEQHQKRQAG
ncbi:MAG: hypothetical protein OEW04_00580 [Nitrospirota bacterium]|nr:hypothetical protein [Nitrospirota bacterium]